jgi:hypothetical protein
MKSIQLYSLFAFFISTVNVIFSQDEQPTFVAEYGDGIMKILYREGLNENEYYQKFLELNKNKISKGSELQFGETYKIPVSEISYRNLGRRINLSTNEEQPIFDPNENVLKKRDTVLKNSVYYLLLDKFNNENLQLIQPDSENRKKLALAVSKELLEQGARVFIFDYDSDSEIELGDYVGAINNSYLKFQGDYQRLLIIDVDKGFNSSATLEILHPQKSLEGKRLAENMERIFKAKKIKLDTDTNNTSPLTEKTSLYLANNALPAMIFIKVIKSKNSGMATSNKVKFVNVIATGIQVDYSNVEMED